MKKKKKKFLRNLIFTIICGFSAICLLGAWTIDNNGNLVSDNLCNVGWRVGAYDGTSGQYDPQYTNYYASSDYIKVNPNTTYTIKATNSETKLYIFCYSINYEYLLLLSPAVNERTFTTDTYTEYIAFNTNANNPSSDIMLNLGSNSLPYEPYGTWYSQNNYDILENDISQLNEEIGELEEQLSDLQNRYEDLEIEYQETYDELQNLLDQVGTTSFDISQYSVSVGNVPNQPSFNYTKTQDITNNFTTIGYLNINDIYTSYIQNGNNNTIYITTPQSNLLTFDLIFNYISQPNTMLKTTLTLPDGRIQQFSYSSTAYDYKEEWTLANLVSSTSIGGNYNMNDISYKDLIITYESQGSILNEIKIGSNNGFNTGFNSGYNTSLNKINELQYELNTKTSLLEKASVDLQNKTNEYNMLLARYQQLTETPLQLNFQNLIWTIASSPFESFKQIWNVDILGFNIANFVIGVMSVFVVMYIIKKIF